MVWGQQLRPVLGRGTAETWVSGYHLAVEPQGMPGKACATQLVVRGLNKPLPVGMRMTHEGVLSLEMELERLFDYHRDSAIWGPIGRVIFIDVGQRHLLATAITRGLQGAGTDEKNQALYEIGRLLGIETSPDSEHAFAFAMT